MLSSLLFFGIFYTSAVHSIEFAELTTNARSTVSSLNRSASFSCCTNTTERIHWHFTYPRDPTVHVIYNGHSIHPDLRNHFDVNVDRRKGCSRLNIRRVKSDNAGGYYCLESYAASPKLRFDLIVLEREPVCHVIPPGLQVRENARIELVCWLKYRGNIAPDTDCRWSTEDQWENVRSYITDNEVLVELSALAKRSLEGKYVRCVTRFVNSSEMMSSNVPLYRHTWTSPRLRLLADNTFVQRSDLVIKMEYQ